MLYFKEISYDKLKIGIKYIIIQHSNNQKYNKYDNKIYIAIFGGKSEKYPNEITCWNNTHISYLNNYNKKIFEGQIELNKYTIKRKYLTLDSQKKNIQNNMERRAINIILRNIIGDNNFYY